MGFLKDLWNEDTPCFRIRRIKTDDTPKIDQRKIMGLLEENKELKKQLETKKVKAIDMEDYELLE